MTDQQSTPPDEARLERPVLYLARCIIGAVTPLSLSTGNPDGVFDTALVTDANDLPTIPGSALTGVLRHLWRDSYGTNTHDDQLFGYQRKNRGNASRLSVSWGALLDSKSQAAEGLLAVTAPERLNDAIYQRALQQIDEPVFRHRVRITHKGAAAQEGKFDRAVLPAGNRFAVELRLWSKHANDPDWTRLLNLLAHPALRLGGATRAGLGKLRCESAYHSHFDFRLSDHVDRYNKLKSAIHAIDGLTEFKPAFQTDTIISGQLRLSPRGLWRIGQRATDFRTQVDKPADLVPITETIIDWGDNNQPSIIDDHERLLFPASSLKGALAHRMAFHANRFAGQWATENADQTGRPALVDALLGSIKDKQGGRAGALFMDDSFIQFQRSDLKDVPHTAIDRFTGGVRKGMLFQELSVYGTRAPIDITLTLDLSRLARNKADIEGVRKTLKATLDDLCQARLPLGSRTTTGNGFFDGELLGPLKDWLDQKPSTQTDTTTEAA